MPIGSAPLPPTFRGVAVWLPVVGLIIGALVSLASALRHSSCPPPCAASSAALSGRRDGRAAS
ncbi:MAG: hypothetical protein ACLSAH_16695 [Bilophila wadsworthia]